MRTQVDLHGGHGAKEVLLKIPTLMRDRVGYATKENQKGGDQRPLGKYYTSHEGVVVAKVQGMPKAAELKRLVGGKTPLRILHGTHLAVRKPKF